MAENVELLARVKEATPGHYTERDGYDWYCVVPSHDGRTGEDFVSRDNARRFLIWLGTGDRPKGWTIERRSDSRVADLRIPDQYAPATIWLREVRKWFPDHELAKL